jgi:threonine aldolase
MLGGGMRQVGVLAAAGLYALDHHVARLADDHDPREAPRRPRARRPRSTVEAPDTNIVMIDLPAGTTADAVVTAAAGRGVRLSAFGPRRLRAVTHLDVTADDARRAGDDLAAILGG